MKVIRFSVNHPVTTCMIMLALVMGGIYSFSRMESELIPSIDIPTLVVSYDMPQTSPEIVHRDITLPVEESLNGVANLVSINAISYEGASRIILRLDWGCNIRAVEIEVRERLNAIKLPETATKPVIKKVDASTSAIYRFDILADDLPTEQLRGIAERLIKPKLERIKGVGEIEIIGGTDTEFQVIGNRHKLAQYNLTVLSLIQCIHKESVSRKSGKLELSDGSTVSLRVIGKANRAFDLENLIVATDGAGNTIRISDVATVVRASKSAESYARIDGDKSVGLSIKKTSDASVVTVVKQVEKELTALNPILNQSGATVKVSLNNAEYVEKAQKMVLGAILFGVLFTGILLFVSLCDLRAALVVGLATPICVISAGIFLHMFGISQNVLALGGLALAAGMTLDSAIVLIESIHKQLKGGLSPKEAAIRGGAEVAGGIVCSTMTTVVVFLPLLLIPGLMQGIFKSMAHAIIWAIFMSMLVGIVFIPMASARLLKPVTGNAVSQGDSKLISILLMPWVWMNRVVNRWNDFSENILASALNFFLYSFTRKVALLVIVLSGSLAALLFIPGKGFLPPGSADEFWISYEPPAGATLDFVDRRILKVEEMLNSPPYDSFIKSTSADVKSDKGRLLVKLKPAKEIPLRNENGLLLEAFEPMRPPPWTQRSKCLNQIRMGCNAIPELSGNTFVSLAGKAQGSGRAPIEIKIYPKNSTIGITEAEQLRTLQVLAKEQILPAVATVTNATYERIKEYKTPQEILISTQSSRQALFDRGLTTQHISDTVRASVFGVKAGTALEQDKETDVVVSLEGSSGDRSGDFDRESIRTLMVRSPATGALHGIKEVATVSEIPAAGSLVLERTNRKPTVNIETHFRPYDLTRESIDQVTDQIVESISAIPGFADQYEIQLESKAKDTKDCFADASLAFVVSMFLVFMIMCCQFENFRNPTVIMITIPLALGGSVMMLNLLNEMFSVTAVIGTVILCGVVVNNGIILVEYICILRRRGVRKNKAIVQGSVRKLKSILVTSTTSVLGMLPLIFGTGAGTELYRGVAAVMVGGILVSTPLTLIALPVLYSVIEDIMDRLGSIFFRFVLLKDQLFEGKL